MSHRALAALTATLVTLVGLAAGTAPGAAAAVPQPAPHAAPPAAVLDLAGTPPTDPGGSAADNPFLPADKDLSECISAVPQPGCGSEARGGWRQGLVFGVVVVALAFVGWRITRTVRRSRRQLEGPSAPAPRRPAMHLRPDRGGSA